MSTRLSAADLKKIDNFNNALNGIMKIAYNLDPENIIVTDIKRKISLGINISPLLCRKVMTPHLIKYKDKIEFRNVDFFTTPEITEQLDDDLLKYLFQFIYDNWFTHDEIHDEVWKKIDILILNL